MNLNGWFEQAAHGNQSSWRIKIRFHANNDHAGAETESAETDEKWLLADCPTRGQELVKLAGSPPHRGMMSSGVMMMNPLPPENRQSVPHQSSAAFARRHILLACGHHCLFGFAS